jgi:hypothetical protein
VADNVSVTAGTGTTIAADEVVDATLGTVKVQYVKLMDGTLNGTTKVAVKAPSTAPVVTDPALVVSISPNSINANGRATVANSAPVVFASQAYNTVAASVTAQVLTGGSGGAIGDWLDFLLVIPTTISCGAVSVIDGLGSPITVFAGAGATPLITLMPFTIPIRAITVSGPWKVTTGANISVMAIGNFA